MIAQKRAGTSYPNTLDPAFLAKSEAAGRAIYANTAAAEAIWDTWTVLLTSLICFAVYLALLSGLQWWLIAAGDRHVCGRLFRLQVYQRVGLPPPHRARGQHQADQLREQHRGQPGLCQGHPHVRSAGLAPRAPGRRHAPLPGLPRPARAAPISGPTSSI